MRKEIKIGLTVMAGLLLLYLVLAWTRSMHFFSANRNTYKAVFQDVSGLKSGDPVTVFGLPSGNVENIELQNEGAIVEFNLSEDITLMTDALAEIRVKELMGGKLVALTPGKNGTALSEDDLIQGTTSLDFSSAFAKAGEFLDKFEVEDIDSLITNINRIASSFAKVAEEIDSMDTGQLLDDVNASASSLRNILDDTENRRIVAKVDKSIGQINSLAANADSTLNSFGDLADNINEKTLPAVDKALEQITAMLDDADGLMQTLEDLTKQMQDPTTLAGKILYDPQLAQDLDMTLDNLNVTLDHIRTKKIHVRMSLTRKQRLFDETAEEEVKRPKQ